jgi:hypothetical protein
VLPRQKATGSAYLKTFSLNNPDSVAKLWVSSESHSFIGYPTLFAIRSKEEPITWTFIPIAKEIRM